ncbi:MAG: glycosyltransferase family 2 protein [Bryobacterales bacterium]|nr:glycosyltransferase family 2 protein [Bryobacterales bacterium]
MSVTAIVPNWNGRRYIGAMLESCVNQGFSRVLVIDNGSTDGSDIDAERTGAEVSRFKRNLGFAAAVNTGIAEASTPLVAILNNDILLAPGWLQALIHGLERHPETWFATGKTLMATDPRLIDGAFDLTSRAACSWRAGQGRNDSPGWNRPRIIQSASMTAALFRRELFDHVGKLDERFESYLEDVDFGLRCARAGHLGLYEPAAVARHWGSATLGVWHRETVRRLSRNQILLLAKHFPRNWAWRMGWPVLVGQLLWGLIALRHKTFVPWLRGKWQGLRAYGEIRQSEHPTCVPVALDKVLSEQEDLIRQLQEQCTFDTYWKLYFALTR